MPLVMLLYLTDDNHSKNLVTNTLEKSNLSSLSFDSYTFIHES